MDRSSGDSGKRLYLKFLLGFSGKGNFDSSFVLLHLEPIEKQTEEKQNKAFIVDQSWTERVLRYILSVNILILHFQIRQTYSPTQLPTQVDLCKSPQHRCTEIA